MPRDRFKSAIYKSIIICDDPKGVMECGSIRKMKNAAQQMERKGDVVKPVKTVNKSAMRNSNKSEAEETVSEQVTEGNHSPSTSQLLEIARGAQRLNHMIDSWSKGLSANSQPKYIGKDLLKGALDLQESLNVLARMQEASQYMAKSSKTQNCSERGSSEKMVIERTDSERYRDQIYSSGIERPCLSADGSSQRYANDIKGVIKNSLSRMNLLEDKSSKQYCLHHRNVESLSEIPSTSSSQSSTAHTDIFGSVDSSSSSVVPQNMIDGPNLITRLMGLQEMVSEKFQSSLQRQWESERVSNPQNPVVNTDMPRLRETHHGAINMDPEMRTPRQTHERIQSKGNDNLGKRLKAHSHKPSTPSSKEKLRYEGSPIVLLKPRCVTGTESERSPVSSLDEKETFGTRNTVKKQIMKGRPTCEGVNIKNQTLPTRRVENLDANETPFRLRNKSEAKETLSRRLSLEERTCVPDKPVAREVKAMEKAPNKMKASGRINHKSQDNFVNEKRNINKIQKATVTSKKFIEKDTLKSKYVSGLRDKRKCSGIKQSISKDVSQNPINETSSLHSTTPNSFLRNVTTLRESLGQKKKRRKCHKSIRQSTAAISSTDNLQYKNRDKKTDCPSGNHIVPTTTTDRVSQEIPAEEIESNELGSEDHGSEVHEPNSNCGPLLEMVGNYRDSKFSEAAEILVTGNTEYGETIKSESSLKSLLLSTSSLLSLIKEYFDTHIDCPSMSQTGNKDCEVTSNRFLLDYATELVKYRTVPDAYIAYPLSLSSVYRSKIPICVDQLLQEVGDGIEFLRSFSKLLGEDLHEDGVYAMLKKDMMSKDAVNGNWDLCWRNGFSVGDAEEVVSHIENSVLNELIDEIYL